MAMIIAGAREFIKPGYYSILKLVKNRRLNWHWAVTRDTACRSGTNAFVGVVVARHLAANGNGNCS